MSLSQHSGNIPYCLRYAYSTWTTKRLSDKVLQEAIQQTRVFLESNELKILEHRVQGSQIQMLVSAKPNHFPIGIAKAVKAKLAIALAEQKIYKSITREFALRSVGENTTQDLEHYLREQVDRRDFVDERFANSLRPYSKEYDFDVTECERTTYGHYWYDLHLVLGTHGRYNVAIPDVWDAVLHATESWHQEQGHRLRSISLLPDHVHLLIRPNLSISPDNVGAGLIERLNRIKLMQNIYDPTFYVATHGKYAMNTIRNLQRLGEESKGRRA